MSGPEDVTNKNEQNESVPITPEKQEVVESVEDMQNRVLSEMTVQNEELYTEDEKIETANSAIGLSIEEVEQEKTAINLDTEIAQINSRAEQLTSESKQEINTTQEKIEKDGVDFIFENNPVLEKIGTKEEYRNYIENIFPESKIKDILYHYSSHDKIKEEGFKYFTETGVPAGAGEMEAIWLTSKSENYWGNNELEKYAAVVNLKQPLDAREAISEEDDVIKEYNKIYEIGGDKEYDVWDKNNRWALQKNRKLAFKEAGYDSVLAPNLEEVTVFDKENIHILGSEKDTQQFKEFKEKI